jgi:2-octaprenyl-6-methoxyphenol hydroxylase
MDRADVIIFGGGLVGLALASAFDSSGLSSIIVDPADPAPRSDASFDGRTSAVSSSSMRMLQAIGVADHLPEPGCPIRRIAVADGLEPGALHFDPEDDEPLGFMHENRNLRAALHARAAAGKNVWSMWKSRVTATERGDSRVRELRPSAATRIGAESLRPSLSETATPESLRSAAVTCDFHIGQIFLPAAARA